MTPMNKASEKPHRLSPPKNSSAAMANRVDTEVATVRSRVWVVEMLMFSISEALRSTRKFSRTRSNTTMVSLSE
ncbi:hypothetical protein D3C78_1820340 [compost metagenome]